MVELVLRPYIDFFSVLGGDPLEPENRECVLNIIRSVKQSRPDIKVYVWTGRTFEDIINESLVRDIVSECFILVDGILWYGILMVMIMMMHRM